MLDSKANNSLWADQPTEERFLTLDSSLECDVAIIGGGFSGLWSAYHLLKLKPELRISIFEANEIGFGASGRNGGWASSDYPVYRSTLIKRHGEEKVKLLFGALHQSIDEIGRFAASHAPQANFTKSGTMLFARNSAQRARLLNLVDDDHRWLDAKAASQLLDVAGIQGALFNEECATVQPYELVMGLARYLSSAGVSIFRGARATATDHGVLVNSYAVTAPIVIHATEVFGSPGRNFIPLYSQMVATEPLSDELWQEIGAESRFTFAEGSHLINYAQRTADNRLAIGGRGATYPWRSALHETKEMTAEVHERLRQLARSWFPSLNDVAFTHAWGGAVAITRNWEPYLQWDRMRGVGRLGGYAGDGVTMSYLAAKIMATLICDDRSELAELHFVNQKIRQWEPEPLRYIAVNSLVKLSGVADSEERLTGRPSVLNSIIAPLILR